MPTIYDFRLNCYNATLTDPEGNEHELTNTNHYRWEVDVDEWGEGTWVTVIVQHPDYLTKQIQFQLSKWPYWPIPIDLEPDYTESSVGWINNFLHAIEDLPLIGSALAGMIRVPFKYLHIWVNDLGSWINDVEAQISQDFDEWVSDVDEAIGAIGDTLSNWVDALKNADDMADDTADWLEDKVIGMLDAIW